MKQKKTRSNEQNSSLDRAALMSQCLRYLSIRRRSVFEIQNFLKKKTADTARITEIIERLTQMEYLNDRVFAESLIASYRGTKAKGPAWFAQTLKRYRISKTIIADVLQAMQPQEAEIQLLLEKKLKTLAHLPLLQQKARCITYLRQRGFTDSTLFRLVDEYLQNTYNSR